MVFKPLIVVISFLTVIPTARTNLQSSIDIKYTATNMYLFPLVGALIGTLAGALGYGLSILFEPKLTSLLIILFITVITGLHHTDALADLGDGLMAKGGRESKSRAMHDHSIGAAGATALILYFIGIFVALSGIRDGFILLTFLVTSEVIAKYMMVAQAYLGKPAWDGLSSPFVSAMKSRSKFIASTIVTLLLVYIASGFDGFLTLIIAFVVTTVVLYISRVSFGGISGDVLGASNEVVRLTCLFALSSVSGLISL